MKVKAVQKQGFVLLVVPEDITFQNCRDLQDQIAKALQVFPEPWMVLDFYHVNFLNSSGIGILVDTLKQLRTRGGGLFVVRCGGPVKRLFEKTNLHRDILVVRDEEAVLAHIAAEKNGD